jgi:hypothetical protein
MEKQLRSDACRFFRSWSMSRVLSVALLFMFPGLASARVSTSNLRLDHALWPAHDPKVIVAGEISPGDKDEELRFRVEGVILGAESYRGQSLRIPVGSFLWPKTLVPPEKGVFCILVLRPWTVNKGYDWYLYAVVPGRKKDYPRAGDTLAARAVLAEELLAQLKAEKSAARQRVLLLQLAPILAKDKAKVVEEFLKSSDAWVRRSALAALVYATEEPKYLEAAATDVQAYFAQTKDKEWVDALEGGGRAHPKTLLLEHYFFLRKNTWTWGMQWDEQEAEKHLRILDGMLKKGVIEDWVRKQIMGE